MQPLEVVRDSRGIAACVSRILQNGSGEVPPASCGQGGGEDGRDPSICGRDRVPRDADGNLSRDDLSAEYGQDTCQRLPTAFPMRPPRRVRRRRSPLVALRASPCLKKSPPRSSRAAASSPQDAVEAAGVAASSPIIRVEIAGKAESQVGFAVHARRQGDRTILRLDQPRPTKRSGQRRVPFWIHAGTTRRRWYVGSFAEHSAVSSRPLAGHRSNGQNLEGALRFRATASSTWNAETRSETANG